MEELDELEAEAESCDMMDMAAAPQMKMMAAAPVEIKSSASEQQQEMDDLAALMFDGAPV